MLTRLLSKLFPAATTNAPAPHRLRLGVEPLEDRLTPNNRFVVPLPVTADNVSTFHSLAAALTTAGLTAGNVVQIEPFSNPGTVTNANVTAINAVNVTVRGASGFAPSELPVIRTGDAITVGPALAGLTFQNVNLQIDSTLTFNTNGTVRNSNVVIGVTGANNGITFSGVTAAVLQGNTVTNTGGINAADVVSVSAGAHAANVIDGNTFQQVDSGNQTTLLRYSSTAAAPDVISNNTFRGTPNSLAGSQLLTVNGSPGLVIRNNTFRDATAGESAVILNSPANLLVFENVFDLHYITPNSAVAALVVTASASNGAAATLRANTLTTGSVGQAVALQVNDATTFGVNLQQNTFLENLTGVYITASSSEGADDINLGSFFVGRAAYYFNGYNDFRSFRTAATASSGAIVVNTGGSDTSFLQIGALFNLFGVADPETVIWDKGDNPNLENVNTSGFDTGDGAFVQNLYTRYLHRGVGGINTSHSSGVEVWVNAMANGMSQAAVANGIIRSPEALGYVVDDLYRTVLGRDADAAGRAHHVNVLASGWTVEQVQAGLYGSDEYATRFSSGAAYVTSLFNTLLDRVPDSASVNAWVALLPSLGRAGVAAGFVNSTEYRNQVVRGLFFDMLKRTSATAPSASDVAAWVNTGLDVQSLRIAFAGSAEFYLFG